MAKIVLGLGTSHTPMLLASDETLTRFLETDRIIKHHDKEGRAVTYGDLLEKADPRMAGMVAPAQLVERQNRARAACRHLREVLSASALDALIIFGDDQNESYLEDCRPAFAVYFGESIRNETKQHQTYSHLPEWYIKNRAAFFDRLILKALADKDVGFLERIPQSKLKGGSSEILNWVAVAGAAEHLELNWFEYVPGYRTPAGTGTGMSFASWA